MRRVFCLLVVFVMTVNCLCINVAALNREPVTSSANTVVIDMTEIRAAGKFSVDIPAYGQGKVSGTIPLAKGETVRFAAEYTPENASVDFGLIDEDEEFYYINTTNGSVDETIRVDKSGDYTIAIRNNSRKKVSVSGSIWY